MCNTSFPMFFGMTNPFLVLILSFKVNFKVSGHKIQNGRHQKHDFDTIITFHLIYMCNTSFHMFLGMTNPFLMLILIFKVNFKVSGHEIQNGHHQKHDIDTIITFRLIYMCNTSFHMFLGMANQFLLLVLSFKLYSEVKNHKMANITAINSIIQTKTAYK